MDSTNVRDINMGDTTVRDNHLDSHTHDDGVGLHIAPPNTPLDDVVSDFDSDYFDSDFASDTDSDVDSEIDDSDETLWTHLAPRDSPTPTFNGIMVTTTTTTTITRADDAPQTPVLPSMPSPTASSPPPRPRKAVSLDRLRGLLAKHDDIAAEDQKHMLLDRIPDTLVQLTGEMRAGPNLCLMILDLNEQHIAQGGQPLLSKAQVYARTMELDDMLELYRSNLRILQEDVRHTFAPHRPAITLAEIHDALDQAAAALRARFPQFGDEGFSFEEMNDEEYEAAENAMMRMAWNDFVRLALQQRPGGNLNEEQRKVQAADRFKVLAKANMGAAVRHMEIQEEYLDMLREVEDEEGRLLKIKSMELKLRDWFPTGRARLPERK